MFVDDLRILYLGLRYFIYVAPTLLFSRHFAIAFDFDGDDFADDRFGGSDFVSGDFTCRFFASEP